MPSFHVFAEMDLLAGTQTDADSFGAKSADEFRLTSSFTVTRDVKVFAVVKGTVLLQPVDTDSSLVNLILKPMNQSKINFPPVKYFIYRGLKKSDFISGASVVPAGSEFINDINAIQRKRNETLQANGQPAENIPLEALLGYDLNPTAQKKLDDFFFNQSQDVQLHTAQLGMHLGNFKSGTKIGFEIVLENPGYFPDVAMGKRLEHSITGAGGSGIDKRHLRERVLNFVDPAAYYGMHLDDGVRVGYRDSTNANNGDKRDRDIYEMIIKNFATRNKVYLDIRNENGYSLNYYGNYQAPDLPANLEIRVGDSLGVTIKAEYYNVHGWPFHVLTNPGDSILNEIYLDLPMNDNPKPLVYIVHGNVSSGRTHNFINEQALSGGPPGWTKTISIALPDVPTASTPEKTVSTVIRLVYIRQISSAAQPAASNVPTKVYTDQIFGPVGRFPSLTTTNSLLWTSTFHRKYMDATTSLTLLYELSNVITQINRSERKIVVSGDVVADISYSDVIAVRESLLNNGNYTVLSAKLVSGNTEIKVVENINSDVAGGSIFYYQRKKIDQIDTSSKKITLLNINLTSAIQVNEDIVIADISNRQFRYKVQAIASSNSNTEITVAENLRVHGLGCMVESGVAVEANRIVYYATPLDYNHQDFPERSSMAQNFVGGTDKKENIFEVVESLMSRVNVELDAITLPGIGETPLITLIESISASNGRKLEANFFALALTRGQTGFEYERLVSAASALSDFHHKFLILEKIGTVPFDMDTHGVRYIKYEVKIAGYNNTGTYVSVSASPSVEVFSSYDNRRVFHSAAYVQAVSFSQAPLVYEEGFSTSSAASAILAADSDISAVVNSFVNDINQINSLDRPAISTLIVERGRKIWRTALASAKSNGVKPHDDRPLYWARLVMRRAIRSHAVIKRYPKIVFDLIRLLESISRGYDEIDFSAAPASAKKVLISGYDPFQLGSKIDRSNPSGAAALTLNGRTVMNNGVPVAYIQSAIFPVRYRDFDEDGGEGVVERFFKKFIKPPGPTPNPVFMIMTLSQGGSFQFWVDRFASRTRGGGEDNENIGNIPFPPIPVGDQFYQTTLPFNKIVPSTDTPPFAIYFNNAFVYEYKNASGTTRTGAWSLRNDKKKIEEPPVHPALGTLVVPSALSNSTTPKKSEVKAIVGSGGDYLSNEIFYRVSLLRHKINPALPTGHYHVPFIQSGAFDPSLTSQLIEVIHESIRKACI
jgi:pyrrolidone-carboxylate peptidase